MIRGTTPTITMKLPSNVSVGDIQTAVVSIQQVGGRKEKIDKHYKKGIPNNEIGIDPDNNLLMVMLSQTDTLSLFAQKTTNIQLKIKTTDNIVLATYPMPIAVVDAIHEEEI